MKKNTLCFLFVVLLFSCKNTSQTNMYGVEQVVLDSGNHSKGCLTQLNLTYEELLTVDQVAQIFLLDKAEVKTSLNDRNDEYGNVYYSWKSDRPDLSMTDNEHTQSPDDNFVGVSGLYAYNENRSKQDIISSFEMGYHQLSDAEFLAIDDNELEDRRQPEKKVANQMLEARKRNVFERVKDLGQSAFWKFHPQNGGELVVLFGNEKFSIYTKVSHEAEENLVWAKKLVQIILDQCH